MAFIYLVSSNQDLQVIYLSHVILYYSLVIQTNCIDHQIIQIIQMNLSIETHKIFRKIFSFNS